MAKCASCGQEYPSDTLVLTVAGRVCAACEVDAGAGKRQLRSDVWRVVAGPFVNAIGTSCGVLFGFAFGKLVIPVFFGAFALLGLAGAWQAGTWGFWEVLDRENGRMGWGIAAVVVALGTVAWSLALLAASAAVVIGFAWA